MGGLLLRYSKCMSDMYWKRLVCVCCFAAAAVRMGSSGMDDLGATRSMFSVSVDNGMWGVAFKSI
jgi:hypothetical protein